MSGIINDIEFKSAYKRVTSGMMYILAKLSNWDLKSNILRNIIKLRNQFINLCPEKCNPGKIPLCR